MPTSDESTAGPRRGDLGARDTGRSQDLVERSTAAGMGPDGADDEPAHVGQIGRFIVLRRLGAGGMGVVYLAYDNALDRKVAVKVIRGLSPAPEMTGRMQREARAMAKLSHPNVLQIYEVGESDGSLFLAMEYVDGGPLGAWLSEHAPSDMSARTANATPDWRAIVAVFVQAGRGLAAAHQAGLVHRDFKPDNVLVGSDGVARVADFGLARLLEEAPQLSSARRSAALSLVTLTATHGVMGTPAYMSPEQHAGAATDARTDQFSFDCSLHPAHTPAARKQTPNARDRRGLFAHSPPCQSPGSPRWEPRDWRNIGGAPSKAGEGSPLRRRPYSRLTTSSSWTTWAPTMLTSV